MTLRAQRAYRKLERDMRDHTRMPDVWSRGCWLWKGACDEEGYAVMPTRALGVRRVLDVLRLRRMGRLPPKSKTLVHDAGCPRHCINPFHTRLVPLHHVCNTG